jgi:hypothetical protein
MRKSERASSPWLALSVGGPGPGKYKKRIAGKNNQFYGWLIIFSCMILVFPENTCANNQISTNHLNNSLKSLNSLPKPMAININPTAQPKGINTLIPQGKTHCYLEKSTEIRPFRTFQTPYPINITILINSLSGSQLIDPLNIKKFKNVLQKPQRLGQIPANTWKKPPENLHTSVTPSPLTTNIHTTPTPTIPTLLLNIIEYYANLFHQEDNYKKKCNELRTRIGPPQKNIQTEAHQSGTQTQIMTHKAISAQHLNGRVSTTTIKTQQEEPHNAFSSLMASTDVGRKPNNAPSSTSSQLKGKITPATTHVIIKPLTHSLMVIQHRRQLKQATRKTTRQGQHRGDKSNKKENAISNNNRLLQFSFNLAVLLSRNCS